MPKQQTLEGTFAADKDTPLVVTTCGLARGALHSMAFVTSHGYWKIGGTIYSPDQCGECGTAMQLRAIRWGIRYMKANYPSDTQAAFVFNGSSARAILENWKSGGNLMPANYNVAPRANEKKTSMEMLREDVITQGDRITFPRPNDSASRNAARDLTNIAFGLVRSRSQERAVEEVLTALRTRGLSG